MKFAGPCVHSKDKNRQLNVVRITQATNAEDCYLQCQQVDYINTLYSACQYTSSDEKCKFILDDVGYGNGESRDAACYVFGIEKSTGNITDSFYPIKIHFLLILNIRI